MVWESELVSSVIFFETSVGRATEEEEEEIAEGSDG
jgi:hypothetical protein